MKGSLFLRIAAIAIATLAVTMLAAALLTAQLIRVEQRQDLDSVLRREVSALALGLPDQLSAAAGSDGTADAAQVDRAVQQYLALHPGSQQHLTVITLGSRTISTQDGPPELVELNRSGALPAGVDGRLLTVSSKAGPLRVLRTPVVSRGAQVAVVSVYGPLAPGLDQARQAFVRIGLASAVGLVLGGVVLLLALRKALRPVHELADAARSVDLRDLSSRVPEPGGNDEVAAMAAEFNRMLDRIHADEQKRTELLAAISHELRTPLAVARGHLELLETLGPEEGKTAADTAAVARRELDRLGRIVDDLTALNAGADSAEVEIGPVFAPDVIDALRDRVAGLAYADVEIRDAPPIIVLGDEDRLTQALLALVVNARTHTPQGTPTSVQVESVKDHVEFRVLDAGPGLDPEVAQRAFDPFVTTKSLGTTRTSGLGLSVVKALTEAQGGTIILHTGASGTSVTVMLPQALDSHP
ncbi:HAMP domain-containing sensor histidine kinase [Microlunatus sagamiharensis]|uniref:HAMP domain-containing sensor histidine kinase n=1 Tax=Microlunatus sagamiharensis TaxID=546874 RepID=UPI001560D752|nr:HAMP domain-containing sensor histidine kinase [Microlunatus sagamiharensis]